MSTQRWTEYEELSIKDTPVHFTPEEELRRFANWIQCQDVGECQVRYDPKKPACPVSTPAPGSKAFAVPYADPERVRATLLLPTYQHMQLPTYSEARRLLEQQERHLLLPPPPATGGLLPEHRIEPEIEPDEDDPAAKD